MTRPTKKELNEALRPLFAAYDRYALGFLTMPKVAKPQPIEWRGLKIGIELVRRGRVVCNVPMPFSCYEFWYYVEIDGKPRYQMGGRPSFIDAVFWAIAKGNLTLAEPIAEAA